MKILIIDNNIDRDCWGSEDLRSYAQLVPNALILTRRAPANDLPASAKGFDKIIVSGSKTSALEEAPWIDRLMDFTKSAVDAGIPFLGVCFGHQILARSLGGKTKVRKADAPEFGWTSINTVRTSELMKGIKNSFYSFSAHYDEVCKLPNGMIKLAESKLCSVQACQVERRPAFGIQFHPEKSLKDAEKIFYDKRKTKNLKLLNPKRSLELYDPIIAETIFGNFFKL